MKKVALSVGLAISVLVHQSDVQAAASPQGEFARLPGEGWIYLKCTFAGWGIRHYAIKAGTQDKQEIGIWVAERQAWHPRLPEFEQQGGEYRFSSDENEISVTQQGTGGILGDIGAKSPLFVASWNRNTGNHTISMVYPNRSQYDKVLASGKCVVGLPQKLIKKF